MGNLALQRGLNEARFPQGVEAMAKAVGKVTQEDVIRTAAKYLSPEQGSALLLTPAAKKEK